MRMFGESHTPHSFKINFPFCLYGEWKGLFAFSFFMKGQGEKRVDFFSLPFFSAKIMMNKF